MYFSPPKLYDCKEHGADTELFIVEGDSAARAVNGIRSHADQAVWPMQGKPMNAMKAGLPLIEKNAQFSGLMQAADLDLALGRESGATRFERFMLLFDPDADGMHSRVLMLLFFYRCFPEILAAGRVHDVYAPMCRVSSGALAAPVDIFTEQRLQSVRKRLEDAEVCDARVTRYRGLASVGGSLLRQYCVARETRMVKKLSAADAQDAMAVFESMRLTGRD